MQICTRDVITIDFPALVGLNCPGDEEKKAVSKEITQLHDKIAYVPVDPEELTAEKKKQSPSVNMSPNQKTRWDHQSQGGRKRQQPEKAPGVQKVVLGITYCSYQIHFHHQCN